MRCYHNLFFPAAHGIASQIAAKLVPVREKAQPQRCTDTEKLDRFPSLRVVPLWLFYVFFISAFFLLQSLAFPYDNSPVRVLSSDASGLLLELTVDKLNAETREFDNRDYQLISYDSCAFTSEAGKPKLPVSHAFLGVPPSASIYLSVVDSQSTNIPGYTPLPVPEKVHRTSPDGIETLADEFFLDRDFYRRDAFYPSENAALVYEGYLRHQRIAMIELRPVQYNPATKLLRKYSRLVVRVDFAQNQAAPPRSETGSMRTQSDREFEDVYKSLLLNYDDAKGLRKQRSWSALAPSQPQTESGSEALKLFVSRPGIYRLDHAMLVGAGIDVSQVDPQTIKVKIRDKQIPIYVHGEADGRFDENDYIEFFGAESREIYTRWNVYWLTWGGDKGMRMVQKSGSPDARSAREVTFFESTERFEEDHLHHKLQNVQPDPNDPEGWFESRDHWFWAGVENGAPKNEVTVEFPVYDLAQTMVRPDFKIELVGCTNFEHDAMISVNGYRVGEEAHWERQDIYSFDGQIPANSIQEGSNELRITRIGSNPADGDNKDSYPYQIYLNWFEVDYLRKLLAVNDRLEFSAPEPRDPDNPEINRYRIGGFQSGDVEIFQISSSNAVCKFRGVLVERYELDQDGRDRMKAIARLTAGDDPAPLNAPYSAYRATFEDQGSHPAQYIAVTSASILMPDRIELDAPSDLMSPSNRADYLIIAHPMFLNEAKELAEWRSSNRGGGFVSRVIDVTDIYDEFGYGMVSPHAIKDFLKFAYNNWSEPAPSYVLIFADATYDFLGINEEFYQEAPELIGFIPTFYIWSTFGQTAVDHLYSTIDGDDGFPDVYLGRIPVEDVTQARIVLDKIKANESGINSSWRKRILSIADDDTHAAGDEIFRIGLEEIANDHTPLGYETVKVYLKDISQQVEQDPQETRRPAQIVEEIIIDEFGKGAVIAQYAGHGGRHVWAHEIVFSITDIESMKEADIYPFLLVLSCYNGYFDLPGELSMAEGMVRADRRGSVAMLSATRLTYGTGNVSLNRFLFDGIFKDKILRIGKLTAISKVEVLLEEGMSWLGQMEEYTLFGDPASRLSIPDYEVHPKLENATVSAGGRLRVLPGHLVDSISGQPGSFDGNMTATASFPGGIELEKSITVAGGSYPEVSFDVPGNITAGEGQVTFYAENSSQLAVGGAKLSVSKPMFLNISHEVSGSELQFYVEASDDAGPSGIKSIIFNWLVPDSRVWSESPMVFDQQRGVYKLGNPIPLSFQGGDLIYHIEMEDLEGNTIDTPRETLKLPSKPNLTIVRPVSASEPYISYGYSTELQQWGINVELSSGSARPADPIQVIAFGDDPDQNNDMVVDNGAPALGWAKLAPDDWNSDGIASAFIPFSLPIGRHTVFVWVDPESDMNHPANVFGDCEETNEEDNISHKSLDITHILLEPGKEGTTRSLDNVFHFTAPAGAVNKLQPISIQPVQYVQSPVNQPDVSFVPLLESQWGGYSVGDPLQIGGRVTFDQPVSFQMKFNLASFKDSIKEELGLAGIPDNQMSIDQLEALERVLEERTSNIAVYLWNDSARKWAHRPSSLVLDNSGNILQSVQSTAPVSYNAGKGTIERSSIEVDDDLTPAGEWVVFFTGTNMYQLYFRNAAETGEILQRLSNRTGRVGSVYYDGGTEGNGTQIRFTVTEGDADFQFGDVLRFRTTESRSENGARFLTIGNVERENSGDGVIEEFSIVERAARSLDEGSDTPIDEWVILFVDSRHFQLRGRVTGVLMRNNEPYTGTVGEEFYHQDTGFRFTIIPGGKDFTAGDRFRFRTAEVGTVEATSESSGILTLMLNQDDRPPKVELTVGNQNFTDGDVVASEPNIQALISDENGVDALDHKLSIGISQDGEDFEPAGEDEYVVHWDAAANDSTVNYWPGKLEPGEYEVKLQVYDFNGNLGTGSIKFLVKREFELGRDSLMNYPNPFERETDITFHLTSVADEAIVKIYTVSGRLIRTIEQQYVVNFVVLHWDGKDEDGREVANGVYYYKVRLKRDGREDIVEIGKMMKLK